MSRSIAKPGTNRASSAWRQEGKISLSFVAFVGLAGVTVLSAGCALLVTGYIYFRDEALHALTMRQGSIEQSYEARINELRRELEKVNSIRLVEEAATNARVHELSSRQNDLESRTVILAAMAQSAGIAQVDPITTASTSPSRAAPPAPSKAATPAGQPPSALGFAPSVLPGADAVRATERATSPTHKSPSEAGTGLRPSLRGASRFEDAAGAVAMRGANHPTVRRVAEIEESVRRIEALQIEAVRAIGMRARRESSRLQAAFNDMGVKPERLAPEAGASGGPFVPVRLNGSSSEFDRHVGAFHDDVQRFERLRRAISRAPVARPVADTAETTSQFGSRIDPFLGRPAFHTGIDFRDWYGAPVFAAAPGSVVAAGRNGGYGLMVEIDHGAGVSTRYAHLSTILVNQNQSVRAGERIGRIGSTGRSTGPHLHYEVRIDDEPMDPARFLRAGARLAQGASSPDGECQSCAERGLP